jgi:hypothetical protein
MENPAMTYKQGKQRNAANKAHIHAILHHNTIDKERAEQPIKYFTALACDINVREQTAQHSAEQPFAHVQKRKSIKIREKEESNTKESYTTNNMRFILRHKAPPLFFF